MFRIFTAAAAFLTASAGAQTLDAATSQEVLPNFNAGPLVATLQQANLNPEIQTISGSEVLVLNSGNQKILLRPRVCNPGCAGLLMYSVMGGGASPSAITTYNANTPPTKAFQANGNVFLMRYLIADYGVTKGSLLVNIGVFDNTVAKWTETATGPIGLSVSVDLDDEIPAPDLDADITELFRETVKRPELITDQGQRGY